LYEKGDGVEQNFDLAYSYYTLANEFGLEVARNKLLELEGKVVKENIRILKNRQHLNHYQVILSFLFQMDIDL
jgi:uncharacterized protein